MDVIVTFVLSDITITVITQVISLLYDRVMQ